jgi:hypothetical protein
MNRTVILSLTMLFVSGCSSTPKANSMFTDQFCHTSQTIKTKNGENVSSQTTVKCSDDPTEKYIPAKLGISKDCEVTHVNINLNGRLVKERIYACKKFDGTYDVIGSGIIR